MEHIFSRTELLIGKKAVERLKRARVAIVGIGGVGSFTAEALTRAGIGHLILVDKDIVSPSNINRQILALHSTIGKSKVEVMKERILDINPHAKVTTHQVFYGDETDRDIVNSDLDYVVDAIDSIKSKIELILQCKKLNIPIISAMGAANKLDPTKFQVSDLSKTSVCPIARILRRELKKKGLRQGLKVVYSTELPIKPNPMNSDEKGFVPASISFVPPVMGLIIAGEVVQDLI